MTFSSSLTDHKKGLVLDASVVINLLSTGHAPAVLKALAMPLFVTSKVVKEIRNGFRDGREGSDLFDDLIDEGVLTEHSLDGSSIARYFELVSGRTVDTLDDGEAETLAAAEAMTCYAAIDEKKATRLASERLGSLKLVTTIDILASSRVQASLPRKNLVDGTLRALKIARMQVREREFDWVVELIGQEHVVDCSSLKRLVRQRASSGRST